MSEQEQGGAPPVRRNKGQSLVAAFREARIAQRPNLRADLRTNRVALRQERMSRLAQPDRPAGAAVEAAPPEAEAAPTPRPDPVASPASGAGSIFSSFLDRAAERPAFIAASEAEAPATEPRATESRNAEPPVTEPHTAAAAELVSGSMRPIDSIVDSLPTSVASAEPPPVVAQAFAAEPSSATVLDADADADADADVAPVPPPPNSVAAARLPLSTIGFGPGMIIRLSQLGIDSVMDLAAADPAWLRTALGDISQLVNVDMWIISARNACVAAA